MGVKKDKELEEMSSPDLITEDEAALYDRQIRLWGFECQKRLRETKVLLVGLNGLGVEIAKNLALSGVKSITLLDEKPVSGNDSSAQFYACSSEPGQTRSRASQAAIQELNPNVKIDVDSEDIASKPSSFLKNFDIIFVTDCPLNTMTKLNTFCRENNVIFFCGDTWGFYGYGFCDLIQYRFTKVFSNERNALVSRSEVEPYSTLGSCLEAKVGSGLRKRTNKIYSLMNIMNNFRETHHHFPSPQNKEADLEALKETRCSTLEKLGFDKSIIADEMLQCSFGELSPVTAAVGGIMASEMIKAISARNDPINNFFLFDGETCTGFVETVTVKD